MTADHVATETAHPFDLDTQVRPAGEGRFEATITDRWNALNGGPNGGYVLAIGLRAMRDVVPFADPLAVSAHFVRPASPGPVELRTGVTHAGGRLATGQVSMIQQGAEILRAISTFGDLEKASGRDLVLNEPPDLPSPESAIDPLAGGALSAFSLTERVAFRTAETPGFLRGQPSGEPRMELWMRFQGGRDPDPLSLVFFTDAAAPVVVEIGEPSSFTIALTVHVRDRPAAGWLACRISTRHVIRGFHEEDFEIWDSEGKLVAQARQLALLPWKS